MRRNINLVIPADISERNKGIFSARSPNCSHFCYLDLLSLNKEKDMRIATQNEKEKEKKKLTEGMYPLINLIAKQCKA